jgi:hypothetical protein
MTAVFNLSQVKNVLSGIDVVSEMETAFDLYSKGLAVVPRTAQTFALDQRMPGSFC